MYSLAGHAEDKEGRAAAFLAAEIVRVGQTGIPIAVFALQGHQGFGHGLEILDVLLAMGFVGRRTLHIAGQGGKDPAVAPGPVALLAVGGDKGRAECGVAPPQAVFFVPQAAADHVDPVHDEAQLGQSVHIPRRIALGHAAEGFHDDQPAQFLQADVDFPGAADHALGNAGDIGDADAVFFLKGEEA